VRKCPAGRALRSTTPHLTVVAGNRHGAGGGGRRQDNLRALPVGRDAESSGVASSTVWRVEFAISSASRRHQSKSRRATPGAPTLGCLDERLARAIDAQLRDFRVAQYRPQRTKIELERRIRGRLDGARLRYQGFPSGAAGEFATRNAYTVESRHPVRQTPEPDPRALVTVGDSVITSLDVEG